MKNTIPFELFCFDQIVQAQHEQQELRQHQQLEEINSHQQQIYPLSNQQVRKQFLP